MNGDYPFTHSAFYESIHNMLALKIKNWIFFDMPTFLGIALESVPVRLIKTV